MFELRIILNEDILYSRLGNDYSNFIRVVFIQY